MSTRIADTLEKARKLLGPNGEHWGKGRDYYHGKYCARGAILQVLTGQPIRYSPVLDEISNLLEEMAGVYISTFNDTHTWEEVDALLARAAEAARQS